EGLQQEWMLRFDRGEPAPEEVEAHTAACAGCREFVRAAAAARQEIRRLPVPQPDPEADRALLAALGLSRQEERPRAGILTALFPSYPSFSRFARCRPAALAVAGLGAFLLTLVVGSWLSTAPGGAPTPLAAAGIPDGTAPRQAASDL